MTRLQREIDQQLANAQLQVANAETRAQRALTHATAAKEALNSVRELAKDAIARALGPEFLTSVSTAIESEEDAKAFVRPFLNEAQLAEFDSEETLKFGAYEFENSFTVQGSDGNRYLIRMAHSSNVWLINEEGGLVSNYCGYPRQLTEGGWSESAQSTVTQKLALEANASLFLETAVRNPV